MGEEKPVRMKLGSLGSVSTLAPPCRLPGANMANKQGPTLHHKQVLVA
jgi:hypothetical protein